MQAILRRCAAAALSVGVAAPVVAAERFAYSFDSCIAKHECRLVSHTELARLRGGFTFTTGGAPVEFTFGIAQAVFVNDQLVAITQVVSELGQTIARLAPGAVRVEVLTAALQSASMAVGSSTAAAAEGARTAAGAATQGAQAGQPGIQAASGAATPGAQAAQPAVQAVSNAVSNATQAVKPAVQGPASVASGAVGTAARGVQSATQAQVTSSATANAGSSAPTVVVNGTPVIPGKPVVNVPSAAELRSLIIQNGTANSAPSVGNGAVATIIQNTVDGAAIRAMTVMEVSGKVKEALGGLRLQNSIRQSLSLP
jgi:hypothetical protein